jgi:dimethylargininase
MPKVLLVRAPSSRLAEGQVSHIADERSSVDIERARSQWESYVDFFKTQGWDIVYAQPSEESPDGVFIEDQIVFFRHAKMLMLCSPGAPTRRSEVEGAKQIATTLASEHGLKLASIEQPGTLDGGDILKIEDRKVVYVGASARTNEAGRTQLRELLEPYGYTVKEIPVTKALHLKSAVTALGDGTVIGWPDIVDDPSLFPKYADVEEEHGVAVINLDEGEVLMSQGAKGTAEKFRSMGFTVHQVDISEFEKLEGW